MPVKKGYQRPPKARSRDFDPRIDMTLHEYFALLRDAARLAFIRKIWDSIPRSVFANPAAPDPHRQDRYFSPNIYGVTNQAQYAAFTRADWWEFLLAIILNNPPRGSRRMVERIVRKIARDFFPFDTASRCAGQQRLVKRLKAIAAGQNVARPSYVDFEMVRVMGGDAGEGCYPLIVANYIIELDLVDATKPPTSEEEEETMTDMRSHRPPKRKAGDEDAADDVDDGGAGEDGNSAEDVVPRRRRRLMPRQPTPPSSPTAAAAAVGAAPADQLTSHDQEQTESDESAPRATSISHSTSDGFLPAANMPTATQQPLVALPCTGSTPQPTSQGHQTEPDNNNKNNNSNKNSPVMKSKTRLAELLQGKDLLAMMRTVTTDVYRERLEALEGEIRSLKAYNAELKAYSAELEGAILDSDNAVPALVERLVQKKVSEMLAARGL